MEQLEETTESLERMQRFDPETLVREADLGSAKNFASAVEPAQRLIDLYNRLSATALQDFPEELLNQVKSRAKETLIYSPLANRYN